MSPSSQFALMAISSPPLPALSPLSTLFSQERRGRRKFQLIVSRVPPNPQPKIKRQNHFRKKLSNSRFSNDFGANQSNQAAVEVPIDERSNTNLVVSHDIDNFGSSKDGVEKEGAKQAALQMHIEESSNSQTLVSQVVKSSQVLSEIGECSRTNAMVSEEVHQLEALVREEEGVDPLGAPNFGLALRIGALFLAQTLLAILFFGLGGFLKERSEKKKKKKREKIVKGEVRERIGIDELEYASKVTEIRAMASLVRQRERDVEARDEGSRDRKKALDKDVYLNSDSSTNLGENEPHRVGEVEHLQSDFDEFGGEHVNVSSLDYSLGSGVNFVKTKDSIG